MTEVSLRDERASFLVLIWLVLVDTRSILRVASCFDLVREGTNTTDKHQEEQSCSSVIEFFFESVTEEEVGTSSLMNGL